MAPIEPPNSICCISAGSRPRGLKGLGAALETPVLGDVDDGLEAFDGGVELVFDGEAGVWPGTPGAGKAGGTAKGLIVEPSPWTPRMREAMRMKPCSCSGFDLRKLRNEQVNNGLNVHYLPKFFTLKNLSDLRAHPRKPRVHSDDLINDGWIRHRLGHLLQYPRIIEHGRHLDRHYKSLVAWIEEGRTMLGSLGLIPRSAKGLIPAMAPKPR